MRRLLTTLVISISLCPSLAEIITQQKAGTIGGTVVDEHGAPIPKAKVNAAAVDGPPRNTLVRFVETDSDGHFIVDQLSWGKYRVFVKKEESGYPDMRWSFYSNDVFQTVVISPSAPSVEIRIQLGPKAAVLTGTVTNAASGAPLDTGFKLMRAASLEKWVSTSERSEYRLLLPSSTNVLLEVSAPGFKIWKFPSALNLQPGTEMHLDIQLEPAHDQSLHGSKFLVPDGFVGWLQLEHHVKGATPVPIEDGVPVFKFPADGILLTSSPGPERGADDEYFYYSSDGSRHRIPLEYRAGQGMIWGQYEGAKGGAMVLFGFFVGGEPQYKKYQSLAGHPGPIPPS